MRLWVAIIAVAVVSLTIKAAGPVVVDVAGPRWTHLNWPILGGLATVTGMRRLKAPMLLAVLVGVVATALLRLVTG